MDYIDEMYKKMLESNGRFPSSEVETYVDYNKPQVQRLDTEEIIGELPTPIEYPDGYKIQVPQSEIIRQNANYAIKERMQDSRDLSEGSRMVMEERNRYKNQLEDSLDRLYNQEDKTYSNPELDKLIMQNQKRFDGYKIPERDFLTEAILNLGPAIGGAFLGESEQLAAPVALKGARDQYELQRKEHLERAKIQRDDAEKRIKALIDARNSGVASFDRGQQRQLERDKAILAATSGLYKMSAEELKSLDQKLMDVNKEIAKERTDKSVDIAKMERSKWEEEQKNKRAEKAAKALKAGEVAGVGDPLPGFTWNKQTPFSQSDLSKLQTAAGDRETLNTIIARVADKVQNASATELSNPASAVRRSIESDLADAQLLYKGESFANLGVLTGPDVSYLDKVLDPPSFANAVMRGGIEEVLKRYAGAIDRVNERFNSKLKYKGFTPNQPLQGLKLPEKKDDKIKKWASDNGISYETAVKILKERGDIE